MVCCFEKTKFIALTVQKVQQLDSDAIYIISSKKGKSLMEHSTYMDEEF